MGTVRSKDGTTIAFDAWGDGPPLIIVDGATAHRRTDPTNAKVGQLLREEFRVYAYDRRGRGESTDTPPYSVEREIEDLAVLIADAGNPAYVFGWSSGGALALDAAAAGLPITRLALFEPPFIVDDIRPPLPSDYVQQLDAATTAGRPGDAAALFLTAASGLPAEMVEDMRQAPFWPAIEEVAHTIAYDGRLMQGTMAGVPLPPDRWAKVTVPTLVIHGNATEAWLAAGARAAADLLRSASLQIVTGEQHSAAPEVIAATLRRFAQG
jgi:pimeloyl-ACP methyl ester carboxylesterase